MSVEQLAIRRILCGVTVGDGLIGAARWAQAAADGLDAALDVVGVYGRTSVEMAPDDAEALVESAQAALAARLTADGIDSRGARVVEGSLADVLVDEAGATNAGIVVVGSHEVEGATALGFGSVAHALGHHLQCPVVSLPNVERSVVGGTFVVGIDGSPFSKYALAWTSALARSLHGSCCAVYCIDDPYDTFESAGWYGREERQARLLSHSDDPTVELIERTGSDTADTLREIANEREAALVVVAAKQRHSLGGLFLGPVADRLLHHPGLPVGVLPHRFLEEYGSAIASAQHAESIS